MTISKEVASREGLAKERFKKDGINRIEQAMARAEARELAERTDAPQPFNKQRTVTLIKAARMFGHATPRRRLPKQQQPRPIEREYGAAIARLVSKTMVRDAFSSLRSELPVLIAAARSERGDGLIVLDANQGRRVLELVNHARDRMRAAVHPSSIEDLARKFADRTSTYQRVQLNRQTKAALGVDIFHGDHGLAARFEHFAAENVALIKDLPDRIASSVEKIATRALTTAQTSDTLAADLDREFGFGERRSELIARDQVGKLYGQLNASRQQEIGIEKFVWRTSEDERVRDEHAVLDGETFDYNDPPDEGFPGEPIMCRCSAEPVFEGILSDASDDE